MAKIIGVPLPKKPMLSQACVEGKSSRLAFNHNRSTPYYDAPRPGHTWHVDYVGPFSTPTQEGYRYILLMVDGFSRYVVHSLKKTQADFDVDWEQHVARVEAQHRQRAVAFLVTDSAKLFDTNKKLAAFNAKNGITHLMSPPYTQELNHVVERNVQTIMQMVRSIMLQAEVPKFSLVTRSTKLCSF